MRRKLSLIFCLCASIFLGQMPETDLWLFELKTNKQGQTTLNSGVNITNRPGYDNQPSFSLNGRIIYYVSVREDKQADIYTYDTKKKKSVPLRITPESEYSPVVTPDGKYLSTVVVEKDSSQRIHLIDPVTKATNQTLEFDSVGYCLFLNMDTVIYYKLTRPHSLRMYIIPAKEDKIIATSPIRTFKSLSRYSFIYGTRDSGEVSYYKYDLLVRKAQRLARYPSVSEDIFWHPEYGLLRAEQATILRYDPSAGSWIVLYDLAPYGIKRITRFAFDPKRKYLVITDNTD